MSSITRSFGVGSKYKELPILKSAKLSTSKNIILFIIDGLGYEYLIKNGKDTCFYKHLQGKATSVFPATTASAIPSFSTGVAPGEHGLTGWHMYLPDENITTKIVKFTERGTGKPLSKYGIKMSDVFTQKTIFEKISNSHVVICKDYAYSDFTNAIMKKANILPYSNLNGFFSQTKKAIDSNQKRKYIYAYWGELDDLLHKFGTKGQKPLNHLKELDGYFTKFINSKKNTDTTIIITADHGLVDYKKTDIVELDKHPRLKEMLVAPLCGEPRVAYCYVDKNKTKEFEVYIKKYLSKYCHIHKSRELVDKKIFGTGKVNKKLINHIGNYILVMKNNYIIKDILPGEKRKQKKACHGGTSKEEMFVPVITVDMKTKN